MHLTESQKEVLSVVAEVLETESTRQAFLEGLPQNVSPEYREWALGVVERLKELYK